MSQGMDISRIATIVAARWKLVALCTLTVIALAFGYRSMVDPIYEATSTLHYQRPLQGEGTAYGHAYPATNGIPERDMQTLVQLATNQSVVDRAAKLAGLTAKQIKEAHVQVQPNGASDELVFTVRATDPERAASIATAYAQAFAADRDAIAAERIDSQIRATEVDLKQVPNTEVMAGVRTELIIELRKLQTQKLDIGSFLTVAKEAEVPTVPAGAPLLLSLLAAALAGLGLGCGAALVMASFDRKLGDAQIDRLPAPVLVKVPAAEHAPSGRPLGPSLAEPLIADAFAALGARLMLDRQEGRSHVMLVSSARAGEGKSSVAANLASALAQSGRRVILIDADLRRPTQDIIFPALQGRQGLSQILTGTADVESSLTLVAPNLAAISSGPRQVHASALLASVGFRSLVDRLGQISDAIIIDAPPVLPVTDGLALAPAADQVLLCARIDASNLSEVEEAHAKLASASSTPQAMVVVGTSRPTGYGYGQETMTMPPGFESPQPSTPGLPPPSAPPPPAGDHRAA